MKKIFGTLLLIAAFVSLAATSISTPPPMHSLEGTWELQSFCNYDSNEVADTIKPVDGYRQVKMYYDGHVMWSRTDPNDTIGRFGYGQYQITMDELIEVIEYGDYYFMENLGSNREFRFELVVGDGTYSQITIDEEGKRTFSENYKRVE
ncbi:hypothetical protein SAMN04490243_0124 [Robiginitalea myxolifaciens]|uniref:Lipocalin-like domain-containing protein n=1 Tax=Robiginitalea myxolifaciens TaxID=400055 RepID=A0A1I6FNB1_9FLAO|nr:hypothetical protein [Robiginitalea myxolifaciens]SFR31297.1 hypothetical protein SAMN04490243_0124 [Robiginitalea myxolifaciens]